MFGEFLEQILARTEYWTLNLIIVDPITLIVTLTESLWLLKAYTTVNERSLTDKEQIKSKGPQEGAYLYKQNFFH